MAFAIANALILLGPLLDVLGALRRLRPLDGALLHALGIGLAIAAFPILVASRRMMGASWRIGVDPGERTTLITGGLFAHVRHPIYSALVMLATGLALIEPNAVSLAAAAAFWLAVECQTRAIEDPYLRNTHDDFEDYAAQTGRFIPGIGRLSRR